MNYEVSETQRQVIARPGGSAAGSVAVLVDGDGARPSGTASLQPRTEAELATLQRAGRLGRRVR